MAHLVRGRGRGRARGRGEGRGRGRGRVWVRVDLVRGRGRGEARHPDRKLHGRLPVWGARALLCGYMPTMPYSLCHTHYGYQRTMRSMSVSLSRPFSALMVIVCDLPVAFSAADTSRMPLASTLKVTSICGSPG